MPTYHQAEQIKTILRAIDRSLLWLMVCGSIWTACIIFCT
jgi:hypothetical protein